MEQDRQLGGSSRTQGLHDMCGVYLGGSRGIGNKHVFSSRVLETEMGKLCMGGICEETCQNLRTPWTEEEIVVPTKPQSLGDCQAQT